MARYSYYPKPFRYLASNTCNSMHSSFTMKAFSRHVLRMLFLASIVAGQCDDIPLKVEVDIQPLEPVDCTLEQEAVLRFHVQKVGNKKFDEYSTIIDNIVAETDVRKACSRHFLDVIGSDRRDLQLFIINGGWSYEFGVGCKFCNEGEQVVAGGCYTLPLISHASPSLTRLHLSCNVCDITEVTDAMLSEAPSSAPTISLSPTLSSRLFPSATPSFSPLPASKPSPTVPSSSHPTFDATIVGEELLSEELARLVTTLERQLTRKLTQKVNKNPESCYRGSNSTVNITVTPTESFAEAYRCYELATGAQSYDDDYAAE